MYFSIKGTISFKSEGLIVLENNGIGYNIFVTDSVLTSLKLGEEAMLYTYLQVREDAFTLFGFLSLQEKDMFLQLISISGIGCRLAQTILSGITPCDLAVAIVKADTKALCGVKGVGKKTAERIVLELKEKVAAQNIDIPELKKNNVFMDASIALQALGWSRQVANDILSSVDNSESLTLNELIALALKNAGRSKL